MLQFFGKGAERSKDLAGGRPDDVAVLVSHALAKFLKRLRPIPKPYLLDLGTVCGPNIEFFARRSCKVRVEDLLAAVVTGAAPAIESAAPLPPVEDARQALRAADATADRPVSGDQRAAPDAPPAPGGRGSEFSPDSHEAGSRIGGVRSPAAPSAAGIRGVATTALPPRPGARPSRRIVLPPRTFSRPGGRTEPGPAGAAPASEAAASMKPGLPRSLPVDLAYPDASFDAIVAWDIFNYYDPATFRRVAAEVRRVLKPGGLVFSYFHARRPERPDAPRRFRILDETRIEHETGQAPAMARHVYQNRDIEKAFTGLAIVELYFLKNALREALLEKKSENPPKTRPMVGPAAPRPPRFTIE